METLKRNMFRKGFSNLIIKIASKIKSSFFEDVIFRNSFDNEGCKQFYRDINSHLISVFRAYYLNPEDLFLE